MVVDCYVISVLMTLNVKDVILVLTPVQDKRLHWIREFLIIVRSVVGIVKPVCENVQRMQSQSRRYKFMITVIEQSSKEREEETRQLFETIRPLLDNGYSYMGALVKIGRVPREVRSPYYSHSWYRDLKEYGESQGYNYRKYSGKGRK